MTEIEFKQASCSNYKGHPNTYIYLLDLGFDALLQKKTWFIVYL